MRAIRPVVIGLALSVPLLGACSGFQDQLGLAKSSPDEFRVVARAPLTLPPDFSLRPPDPGAPRPQTGTPTDQARRAVFRAEPTQTGPTVQEVAARERTTVGTAAILQAAGATDVSPDIRETVNVETQQINDESETFTDQLIFWRDSDPTGDIVDPSAEQRRLNENAALGEPTTAGDTPTIERRSRAIFEDIF